MPNEKHIIISKDLPTLSEEDEKAGREFLEQEDAAKKLVEAGVPMPDFDRKPFASLMRNDEELKRTFEAVEVVIWRSFGRDIQREPFKQVKPTSWEVKRRFKICEAWIRHARGDLGFSLEKTLDLMGHALRCELDGVMFDPSKADTESRIWTPT